MKRMNKYSQSNYILWTLFRTFSNKALLTFEVTHSSLQIENWETNMIVRDLLSDHSKCFHYGVSRVTLDEVQDLWKKRIMDVCWIELIVRLWSTDRSVLKWKCGGGYMNVKWRNNSLRFERGRQDSSCELTKCEEPEDSETPLIRYEH